MEREITTNHGTVCVEDMNGEIRMSVHNDSEGNVSWAYLSAAEARDIAETLLAFAKIKE